MQIALLVVVGIVFTFVRAMTRTVLASYLLHVSYNSFQCLSRSSWHSRLRLVSPVALAPAGWRNQLE